MNNSGPDEVSGRGRELWEALDEEPPVLGGEAVDCEPEFEPEFSQVGEPDES